MIKHIQTTLPESWTVPVAQRAPDHTICPYIAGEIRLSQKSFGKITSLMDHFDVEWLAYLLGEWRGDTVFVKDLAVPAQKTTASSVSDVEDAPPNGTIGVIHSHVRMGAFFSGTDDQWINNNHNVSIVVSKKDGVDNLVFKSQVRKTVACGVNMLMELPVKLVEVSQRNWLEGVVDRVKSVVYVPSVVKSTQQYLPIRQGAIMDDMPLTPDEKTAMKKSYEECVKAIAESTDGHVGMIAALAALGDDDLENAVEFIDVNQGSAVIAQLLEGELTRRVRHAAKEVGMDSEFMALL